MAIAWPSSGFISSKVNRVNSPMWAYCLAAYWGLWSLWRALQSLRMKTLINNMAKALLSSRNFFLINASVADLFRSPSACRLGHVQQPDSDSQAQSFAMRF